MKPMTADWIRGAMPDLWSFETYPDREVPWLLSRTVPDRAKVSELRKQRSGKLLDRQVMRGFLANCGGVVCKDDLLLLAEPKTALVAPDAAPSRAAQHALSVICSQRWETYELSLSTWGGATSWGWSQTSRRGVNLVLQVGFPSGHQGMMDRTVGKDLRSEFECTLHPVRADGPPTLAWVRLDLDENEGCALIEEVQSDWMRFVNARLARSKNHGGDPKETARLENYSRMLSLAYANWAEVALFAALILLVEELGIGEIWMHSPQSGRKLKGITGPQPPRDLYTKLPRRFTFESVEGLPKFLRSTRRGKPANRARVQRQPMWRLAF